MKQKWKRMKKKRNTYSGKQREKQRKESQWKETKSKKNAIERKRKTKNNEAERNIIYKKER